MLASTGLDSKVWIWDGQTFGELSRGREAQWRGWQVFKLGWKLTTCKDRLRKIDQHEGFVKGVCWDPVGNYLATQVSHDLCGLAMA
jgi:protein HIRA/HIR1